MEGILFDNHRVQIDKRAIKVGGSWQGKLQNGVPTAWDMDTLRIFYYRTLEYEHPVILDIGANTGSFCLLAGINRNIKGFAFEPVPHIYEILTSNISKNKLEDRIRTFPLALAEKKEVCKIKFPRLAGESGLACLGRPQRFKEWDDIPVQVDTLDNIAHEIGMGRVDLVKINTEGCELFVLKGGENLIREHKPMILAEYYRPNTRQFGYDPEEIRALLQSWGYESSMISKEDMFFFMPKQNKTFLLPADARSEKEVCSKGPETDLEKRAEKDVDASCGGTSNSNTKKFSTWINAMAKANNRLYYRDQTPESLHYLVEQVRSRRPTQIVELGTLSGMSLRAWIETDTDARITAIDLSFKALEESMKILPIDLSRVKLIKKDIRNVDFSSIWQQDDVVLLYVDAHDLPNVNIMEYILNNTIPSLPPGSFVIVDDLWYSSDVLDDDNIKAFFDNIVNSQIDSLLCFHGFYASYWKGGSFFGFREVVPLMKWVNKNHIELEIRDNIKTVLFEVPEQVSSSNLIKGDIQHNPVSNIIDESDKSIELLEICKEGANAYRAGNINKAMDCFVLALKNHPSAGGIRYSLGVCLARTGRFEDAGTLLKQELDLPSPHPQARALLKDIEAMLHKDIKNVNDHVKNTLHPSDITFFTLPKPFRGHINTIQLNAIQSWMRLDPRPEIILLGDEEGVEEVAKELGLRHIPDIKTNEFGTPLINNIFEQGEEKASCEILCYLNADIILLSDFMPGVEQTKKHFDSFLMIGQRWDLNIPHELDFSDNEWEKDLCEQVAGSGSAHMTWGIDYFVFKKGLWKKIPPFAIGRTAWDNWLVYQPLLEGKAVVDASQMVTAIHQNHDYSHVQGGEQSVRNGIEAQRNRKLAGELVVEQQKGDIKQADWRLTPSGLKKDVPFCPVSRLSLFFRPEKSESPYLQTDFGSLADISGHIETGPSKKGKEILKPCLARVGWQEKEILYNSHFEWVLDMNRVKSPKASVVVISWRFHPDTLENFQALDAQRDQNFELIFVNNGAPEDAFRDLMPYIDVYVKLNKNTGDCLARNMGAVFAKAPVIIFLDDDGIPGADFVKAHLEAFDAYDIIAARGVCNPKTDNLRNRFAMHYDLGNKPFPRFCDLEGNVSYLAHIFFEAGGWDDEIFFGHGGVILSLKLMEVEPDMRKQIYLPGAVIDHDYAGDDNHLYEKRKKQDQSRKRLLLKYPDLDGFLKSWTRFQKRDDMILKKKYTVSIVIITYNRSHWISEAIQSALDQTRPAYEILIVDDGSTDNTGQIVRSFSDKRIRYIKNDKNLGRPFARNIGVKEAKGEYILWLDDDDILIPETLERYIAILRRHPDGNLIYGKLQYFDDASGSEIRVIDPVDYSDRPGSLLQGLTDGCKIPNPGTLIKKSLFHRAGYYDEDFSRAQDYEFWTRAAEFASPLKVDDVVCRYRIHDQNISHGNFIDKSYESIIIRKLLERHPINDLIPGAKVVKDKETMASFYRYIGKQLFRHNDYYNARKYIERIESDRLTAQSLETLLTCDLYMGNMDRMNDRLTSFSPTDQRYANVITRFETTMKTYTDSVKEIKRGFFGNDRSRIKKILAEITNLHGVTFDIMTILGDLMQRAGQKDNAFQCYKRALSCNPENDDAFRAAMVAATGEKERNEVKGIRDRLLYKEALFDATDKKQPAALGQGQKARTDRNWDQYRETRLHVNDNFDEIRAMIEDIETAESASEVHITVSRCSLEDYLWLKMKQDKGQIRSLTLTDAGRQIFPTVSLVMFTYNRIEYTWETLMTLMHNTRYPFDLVIIDNCSTDGTREWLEEIRGDYAHRIKNIIYNSRNKGLPGPTNEFWQGAKADLVGKVDNDTLVPEGWLEKLVEAHKKLPKLAVVGGYHFRPEDFDENAARSKLYREAGICLLPDTHIGGCCYLMKKSVQEKYGFMDVHPTLKTHGWTQYQQRLSRAGYLVGYLYPLIQLEYMDDPRSEKCLIETQYKEYAREIWKERGVKFQSSDQLVSWIRNDAARVVKSPTAPSSSPRIPRNLLECRDAPLVSMVILTHNQLALTKICLDSIQRETQLPVELIVVDNGSSDGTVKYLETLKEQQENIILRVIRNKINLGFAAGNNQGIAMARGRYILLMNNDTAVTPGWLERMITCLETHPRAGIVGPRSNYVSGPQLVKNVDYNTRTLEGLTTFAKRFAVENAKQAFRILRVVGFCMLIKREVINKIGGLDNRFGLGCFEDDDFSLRAGLAGFEAWVAEDCFVHHYGNRTFVGAKIDHRAILKRNWEIFKKKWGMPDTLPFGSPYRLAEIAADGFDPEKHYIRLPKSSLPADVSSEKDDREMGDRSKKSMDLQKEANILAHKGQSEQAEKMFLKSIGLSPGNKKIYFSFADMLINDRQYNAALGVLKEIPCDDDDPKKLELTGYCLEGLNQDDDAGKYADKLLHLDRASGAALNLKGMLARKKGRDREAEDYFLKAIAADKDYGMAHSNLGVLRLAGDNKNEALDLLEKGFILSPTNHDVLTVYHTAAVALGTFERAEKIFREKSALIPYHKMIHFQLIDLLLRQQKYKQAMNEIEKAIVEYGADEGLITAALDVRKRLGPKTIKKASQKKGTVSLCMIVKNEEKYIAKCLMNLKPLANEMIVVDTGSSDRTKVLSEIFGAKIYDFKWNDDFSEARNCSISKAQGDWILVMDADEIISPRDYKAFKEVIRKKPSKPVAYSFVTRNYHVRTDLIGINPNKGTYKDEEKGYGWISSEKVRLFKNRAHIRFEYPVHEKVEPFLRRRGIRIKECAVPVHHYGKLNKTEEARKGDEYFRMGVKKLEKTQHDPMAVFELAVQAGQLEKWEEAIELWQSHNRLWPHVPAAHVNLGTAYQKTGKLDRAIESAERAMEIDPDMNEAPNNYALYKILKGHAKFAIPVLENLAKKDPEYLPGRFKLAVAYCCVGRKEDGLKEFKRLSQTSIGPGLADACQSIARELVSFQQHNYAKSVLGAATEIAAMSPLCRDMQDRGSQNDLQPKMMSVPTF